MNKVQDRLDAVWASVYAANWTNHVKDVGSYGCRLNGVPASLGELVLESLEAANLAVETLKECLDKTKAEQEEMTWMGVTIKAEQQSDEASEKE